MTIVTDFIHYAQRVLRQPVGELSRAQRSVRNAVDLVRHCARTLQRDRAAQMAAALTYRTIFSLVPTVVLSLLVLQAVYKEQRAIEFLNQTVIRMLNVPTPELQATISEQITQFTENAYNLSFKSIGGIGLVILIWAALAMVVTVEQCFNRIYNSPTGRPWHHRITIYWAILTLGPVLIMVSVYLGSQLVAWVQPIPGIGSTLGWLTGFTPLAASWLLLFLLYVLMPNTKVNIRPALIGSFVAAVLWELGKSGFQLYVAKAVGYSAIYGSLGLIPLFLVWLYLTWWIVLFGLELTYTLQSLRGFQLRQEETRAETQTMADPRWLIPIMTRIGTAFAHSRSIDSQQLAQELRLPIRTVVQMGQKLQEAGLLHQVQRGDEQSAGYTLARPPDRIAIADLIDLAGALQPDGDAKRSQPEWAMLDRLTQAQRAAVGDQTLASLVEADRS